MAQVYTLKQALSILENGHFHEIAYVSANRNKKEGGRIIRINQCKVIPHKQQENQMSQPSTPNQIKASKSQFHSLHATRNLTLATGDMRKCHIHLIFQIDKIPII